MSQTETRVSYFPQSLIIPSTDNTTTSRTLILCVCQGIFIVYSVYLPEDLLLLPARLSYQQWVGSETPVDRHSRRIPSEVRYHLSLPYRSLTPALLPCSFFADTTLGPNTAEHGFRVSRVRRVETKHNV